MFDVCMYLRTLLRFEADNEREERRWDHQRDRLLRHNGLSAGIAG